MIIPYTFYYFLLIELFAVSILDLKTRQIKNFWSFLNLGLLVLFVLMFPDSYRFGYDHFIHSIVFFSIGFIFFIIKIMGAGDTKFLTTFFLLIPTDH